MALSSFAGTEFRVQASQPGVYPLIARDADGAARYKATIRLSSAADYAALANAVALVTVKRALGSFSFVAVIEAGPASDALVVPTGPTTLGTFTALLTGFTPRTSGYASNDYRADCEWLILSDVTP